MEVDQLRSIYSQAFLEINKSLGTDFHIINIVTHDLMVGNRIIIYMAHISGSGIRFIMSLFDFDTVELAYRHINNKLMSSKYVKIVLKIKQENIHQ